jgi:hypothetical protein
MLSRLASLARVGVDPDTVRRIALALPETERELRGLLTAAWRCQAPRSLTKRLAPSQ